MEEIRIGRETPWGARKVEDLPLSGNTIYRRVLRPILDSEGRIEFIAIIMQKKTRKTEWVDYPLPPAQKTQTMKKGDVRTLIFNSEDVEKLFEHFPILSALKEAQITGKSPVKLTVIDSDLAEKINELPNDELLKILDSKPNLAIQHIYKEREAALAKFKLMLEEQTAGEKEWQEFFRANDWVFGYGLDYHFLSSVQSEARVGHPNLAGGEYQAVDEMMATSSENAAFCVLVEVKKPQTLILGNKEVRAKTYSPHGDLVDAVSQIQSYKNSWSGNKEGITDLKARGIETAQPKGILLIGNTSQLDNEDKKKSFELYRRNLIEPKILTFDELYVRARHILGNLSKKVA